jgi:hypothetical protein
MRVLAGLVGLFLIIVVLWDAFETVVLPRRVTSEHRLTATFYRFTWGPWASRARHMAPGGQRENYLGLYGPLSLLFLIGVWILGLLVGFGVLQWACGSALSTQGQPPSFGTDLYMSGTTFFTLGLGDVYPRSGAARFLTVAEVGTGFGFLALTIGYVPVVYQAFARREVDISLLDARAGSPPTALELLRRCAEDEGCGASGSYLRDWERWAAELLETQLSYPLLGYFRSQHENQSWVAALTTILDVSALISAGLAGGPIHQARLTFAMARHAAVDLAHVYNTPPRRLERERLSAADLVRLRMVLASEGTPVYDGRSAERRLAELREMYEPYVNALAGYLLMPLPAWLPPADARDNWESTAWGETSRLKLL